MSSMSDVGVAASNGNGSAPVAMNKKFVRSSALESHQSPAEERRWVTFLNVTRFCRLLGFISSLGIAVILCVAMHEIVSNNLSITEPDYFTEFLALLFHFFTALILITAMMEWGFVLRRITILASWIFLGGFQMYLAVLVVSNVTCPGRFSDGVNYAMRVSSLILFIVGFIFAILGVAGGKTMERKRLLALERARRIENGEDPNMPSEVV